MPSAERFTERKQAEPIKPVPSVTFDRFANDFEKATIAGFEPARTSPTP